MFVLDVRCEKIAQLVGGHGELVSLPGQVGPFWVVCGELASFRVSMLGSVGGA